MRALSDIATRRTEARTNLARAKASYDALRATSPEGLPQVVQSELITRLKGELAVTESEYGEKSRLFKDDWPGMQTLKGKLEQGRARVEQETNAIVQERAASPPRAITARRRRSTGTWTASSGASRAPPRT
jgi:uncharacterized protein involved in exopolysaccharide biosynthesis